jgi:hypothetical protein
MTPLSFSHIRTCYIPAGAEFVHPSAWALLLYTLLLALGALATLGGLVDFQHPLRRLLILANLSAGTQLGTALLDSQTVTTLALRAHVLCRLGGIGLARTFANRLIQAVTAIPDRPIR